MPDILDFALIGRSVHISARTGYGIENLLNEISKALPKTTAKVQLLVPFAMAKIANDIRNYGIVESEEYTDNGIKITAIAETAYLNTIEEYIMSYI